MKGMSVRKGMWDRCELHPGQPREPLADQAREPQSQQGERQPGRNLRRHQGLGQEGEEHRHGDARGQPGHNADQRRAGRVGGGEAAYRAHDHHAFDAQVEDARAFRDELSGRRQQQWRGRRDDRQNDGFQGSHRSLLRPPWPSSSVVSRNCARTTFSSHRHARTCSGHLVGQGKTRVPSWMAGTSPAMTLRGRRDYSSSVPGHDTRRERALCGNGSACRRPG